jgi:hypothetical protein
MFFWGPFSGPGAARKKGRLLSLRDPEGLFALQPPIFTFSFTGLDPDGCLVADRLRVRTKILEKPGAVTQKGHGPLWMLTLQKKIIIFCDGEVFSIDRGLLMGA